MYNNYSPEIYPNSEIIKAKRIKSISVFQATDTIVRNYDMLGRLLKETSHKKTTDGIITINTFLYSDKMVIEIDSEKYAMGIPDALWAIKTTYLDTKKRDSLEVDSAQEFGTFAIEPVRDTGKWVIQSKFTWKYDSKGNLIFESDIFYSGVWMATGTNGITKYFYDTENRIIKIKDVSKDDGGTERTTTTFEYLSTGEVLRISNEGNTKKTKHFYFDSGNKLLKVESDNENENCVLNYNNNQLTSITFGNGNKEEFYFENNLIKKLIETYKNKESSVTTYTYAYYE